MGVLVGRVTRGPGSPVSRGPRAIDSNAAAGVTLSVTNFPTKATASATTDTDGRFRVNLAAGTYEVTIGALPGLEFTKDLPATVIVRAGQETRLDVRIDTGIR